MTGREGLRRIGGGLLLVLACATAFFAATALGATPAANALAAAAQVKDWRIDRMDVVLDVQQNGDVIVDETITFTFRGNYTYVGRLIPTRSMEGMSDIEVRDADGIPLPEDDGNAPGTFSTFMEGDRRIVQINFDLTDASATWTIHYRAEKTVLFWGEGDELRWYVFDAETPAFIDSVRVTVKLPGAVAPEDIARQVQTDSYIAWTADSPAASTAVYEAGGFGPYTEFWIVTGFPKGVVKYAWTAKRVADYVVPIVGLFLPVATLLTMLLIWLRRGRDEPALVYAQYVSEPPSNLAPGLVGALIDEKVDTKEVLATIVDLARRGFLEITDSKEEGHIRKPLTTFTRLRPFDELEGFEKKVAESLFALGAHEQVTSAQLKNHFYSKIPPLVDQVYEAVTKAGLFAKNPNKTRKRWKRYGTLTGVVLIGLAILLSFLDVDGWGWLIVGAVVSTIIIWIFSSRMPQRTAKGAQERRKWEAFRNYLRDLTRFTDMEAAAEKFETALPYAIALGVEKEWLRRFEDATVPAPGWYRPPVIIADSTSTGPVSTGGWGGGAGTGGLGGGGGAGGGIGGGLSLDTISDGLFRSLSNMSSVLTSFPTSSGGSGSHGAFGGGGFSGGGGGFGGGFSGGGGGGGFRAG